MNNLIINIATVVGSAALGLTISVFLLKNKKFINLEKNRETAEESIEKSKQEAEGIKAETQTYVQKKKENIEQEKEKKEQRIKKLEESLNNKESALAKKEERAQQIKERIKEFMGGTDDLQDLIKKKDGEIQTQLTAKTGSSKEAFKKDILNKYNAELGVEGDENLAKIEESLRENANKIAKKHIVNIIQRLCSPTSVERRAVNIKVPKDQIKGKLVGKGGKNIEELETLLPADIIFNDLPNTIRISAFNLVERRIAEKTIEKLVKTRGGIDKSVIHRALREAKKETDDELYEIGKNALEKIGIKHDSKDFCRIVGRLQYRTSYSQNIMMHSMEVAWIATMLGSELGLNVKTCKIGGFLHDLGKAIDQDPDVKDTHDQLTKELMEKYGFSPEEVHAAWTHHDSAPQKTPEALIVKAADAISAGRPGARQESFEKYIERIQALENTAKSFEGVKRAFALSAGREVRVIVDPESVSDQKISEIAKILAEKIERDITYPGKIKVNVIRRTKHTEIAK